MKVLFISILLKDGSDWKVPGTTVWSGLARSRTIASMDRLWKVFFSRRSIELWSKRIVVSAGKASPNAPGSIVLMSLYDRYSVVSAGRLVNVPASMVVNELFRKSMLRKAGY